jgi:hypothetical protein
MVEIFEADTSVGVTFEVPCGAGYHNLNTTVLISGAMVLSSAWETQSVRASTVEQQAISTFSKIGHCIEKENAICKEREGCDVDGLMIACTGLPSMCICFSGWLVSHHAKCIKTFGNDSGGILG